VAAQDARTVKDHDSLITAARDLRKRIEQLAGPDGPQSAPLRADLTRFIVGVEDLADRVTLIEKRERRLLERLDFVSHLGRLLGHEDWTVPDPDEADPGALATEAQAIALGASGPASSLPPSSPAPVATA
jgi:hypothetical protein